MKQTEQGIKIYQLCLSGFVALCLAIGLLLNARAQATIITVGENSKLERTFSQPTELLQSLGITAAELEAELKERPRVILRGAGFVHNVEVNPVLAENSDILQSLGIPLELAQKRLQVSIRILVRGAGAVRGLRSVSFTDFRQTVQRILVRGAGYARRMGLEELPTPEPSPTPTDTPIPTDTPTFTPSPTATDTATPTATNTPSPTATPDVFPALHYIRPNQGSNAVPNDINIRGERFADGATVRLGTITLTQTTFVDATHLQAVVPQGFAAGLYDLTVTNPDGGQATLANAYTVFDSENNDDLFANDYELWSDPAAPHAGAPAELHLLVRRQGGKQPLAGVTVRSYLGDPNAGGTVIGNGTVPLLSPRSADNTTGVAWTPPGEGNYIIYAVIDPDNGVAETYESNNVLQRTLTVLPAAPDQVAPHVDSFTINQGAPATSERQVRLDATASDEPPGSGVAKLLYVEYEFSEAANQWAPVQESGWVDYAVGQSNYAWELLPTAGLKYLQVWAADGAGNISILPFKAYINFAPATHRVRENQRKVYRYRAAEGQSLTARLEPVSGDPDLYLWPPDHATRPPWVSNLREGVDDLSISAPISGVYQVEVFGFSAAEYRLFVDVATGASVAAVSGGIDPDKPTPTAPPVDNASTPPDQLALNSPGQTEQAIYLPVISK